MKDGRRKLIENKHGSIMKTHYHANQPKVPMDKNASQPLFYHKEMFGKSAAFVCAATEAPSVCCLVSRSAAGPWTSEEDRLVEEGILDTTVEGPSQLACFFFVFF